MKRLWNCWLLCLLSIAVTSSATAARHVENRYLFILETSKEMKREADPAKNVLLQLLYTGVMGQMRAGDTFGVWNYDDTLHATLPMQTFSAEDRETITSRTKEYLEQQKFTGGARLETALIPMLKIAKNSPNLTVILISDGKQPISGTPYDADIRALHKKYYDELRQSKLPFITVLVANKGEFISYAVNSALGPVRVPRIPKPPEPTNVVAKVEPPKPVIKRAAQPLILRGPLPKNNSTVTVPPPAPVAPATTTNVNSTSVAPVVPTEVAKTPQVETNKPAEVTAAPVSPPPAPTAAPAPAPAPAPVVAVTNASAKPAEQPQAKKPEVAVQSEPVSTPKPAPSTNSAAPIVQSTTNSPAKEQASNVATFTVKEPEKNVVKASTPPAPVEPTKETAAATPTPVEKEQVTAVQPKAPTDQHAVITQTESPLNLRYILIGIGAILFSILIVLVLLLRKNKNAHSSLITQSIDKRPPVNH